MIYFWLERLQQLLRENGRDTSVHYLDEDGDEISYAARLCRETGHGSHPAPGEPGDILDGHTVSPPLLGL